MATPSSTFTEIVTTTLRHVGADISDNVTDHNGLLRRMKKRGNIKSVSGGYELQMPLEYAENGTYQRYSGYEQLDTSSSDVLTSAKFDWKQASLMVTASGREIRMNMGNKERLFDLVEARIKNAKNTAANNLSVDIYSDGTASNQINGLAALISTAGTGTVGGINSTTYSFWQNQYKEATGTNTAASPSVANSVQFRGDMNALWLTQVRGMDKPDVITMSHDFYALYELSLQDRQRYADASSAEDGFESLKYKTADVIFDDNSNFSTTAEKAYFLNSKYLYLVQHRDAKFTPEEQKVPTNQDAIVVPLYWMGNLVVTNRDLQGVLFDAA